MWRTRRLLCSKSSARAASALRASGGTGKTPFKSSTEMGVVFILFDRRRDEIYSTNQTNLIVSLARNKPLQTQNKLLTRMSPKALRARRRVEQNRHEL